MSFLQTQNRSNSQSLLLHLIHQYKLGKDLLESSAGKGTWGSWGQQGDHEPALGPCGQEANGTWGGLEGGGQ